MLSNGFDYLCRKSANHGAGWNVFVDHRTCRYDSTFTYGYTLKDGNVGTDPHFVANLHGSGNHIGATVGIHYMVECGYHAVVTHQHIIAYGDSALILEFATGIDENTFADSDILSTVGIEWGETARNSHGFLCL